MYFIFTDVYTPIFSLFIEAHLRFYRKKYDTSISDEELQVKNSAYDKSVGNSIRLISLTFAKKDLDNTLTSKTCA